jgi:hypothetical protein
MSEISAVAAGRALILRNDTRNQREVEVQNRQRLEQLRQDGVDRQSRLIAEQSALDRRRLQDFRGDQRQDDSEQRLFDAQLLTEEVLFTDRRVQDRENDIELELLRARALDFERSLPPLTPRQPIGNEGLRTPEEIEIARQLAEPDIPPPVGFVPPQEPLAALTPFEAPAPAVAGVDEFGPSPAAELTEEVIFDVQERDRVLRLNERRAEEGQSQVQQEFALSQAEDRINETDFDPERPRGTIVDVFG